MGHVPPHICERRDAAIKAGVARLLHHSNRSRTREISPTYAGVSLPSASYTHPARGAETQKAAQLAA
ncbi:hypothetical protein DB34_10850 [Acetobacter pasteurianus]|nr:hypothetical protein DB34_10850 [Acetobacter pasteurianus]